MHKRGLSETQRKLARNFTSLAFLKAVNVLVPLIVLPYSIKKMGLESYGTIVFATSIINYFVPLVDYSFGLTGTREIAKNKHSHFQLVGSEMCIRDSCEIHTKHPCLTHTICPCFLHPQFKN